MGKVIISVYHGEKVEAFIPQIAQLRIEVFREYPFLYIGNSEYEKKYLHKFSIVKEAIVVVAMEGKEVVGVSTGLPFSVETEEIKKPFIEAGLKVEEYFYFGESTVKKTYRKQGIGDRFFVEREQYARKLGRFKYLCFCTLEPKPADPRRPPDYQPLEGFWKRRGFMKHPELVCHIPWQQIDEEKESYKPLVFWIKKL